MTTALGLYVHIPWCVRKCPYCDFNSHALTTELPETAYLDALLTDLEALAPHWRQRHIDSVFIGGGTPSLMQANTIGQLLSHLQQHTPLSQDAEITMEANPGTLEHQALHHYADAGVNRLSLGIQSFNDAALQRLGRVHGSEEAHRAIEAAQQAGFNSCNIDIMYGLPSQTADLAQDDLRQAMIHQPHHLSWYQLTLEPNTAFFHQQPSLPAESCLAQMEQAGLALLAQHGYQRYEVSAFARKGALCRHNLTYWTYGDYLGIGAGAHSKLSQGDPPQGVAVTQTETPQSLFGRSDPHHHHNHHRPPRAAI